MKDERWVRSELKWESELYFRKLVILETLGVKLQNNN